MEEDRPVYFNFKSKYYSFLSNWYESDMTIDGKQYYHVEGYYQYKKYETYNPKLAHRVMFINSPRMCRKVGDDSIVTDDEVELWSKVELAIVKRAVVVKFASNTELSKKLLDTNNRPLIFNDPTDGYWGIGPDNNGENALGTVLTGVRSIIRNLEVSLK